VGVTLFPNPSAATFTIDIPTALGSQQYSISDITGRIITNGNLSSGKSNVDVSTLSNGLYTISLRNSEKRNEVIMLRFSVAR
jgi:hypothetical protein